MNYKGTNPLAASDFARMLACHGRSSNVGTFPLGQESNVLNYLDGINKLAQEESRDKDGNALEKGDILREGNSSTTIDPSEDQDAEAANLIEPGRKTVLPCYSFHRRQFKVKGEKAWEYAMRDLGSVDTLLNRYGFVEPKFRKEASEVKDKSSNKLK